MEFLRKWKRLKTFIGVLHIYKSTLKKAKVETVLHV